MSIKSLMRGLFLTVIFELFWFVRSNIKYSHFMQDDYDHYADAFSKSALQMMKTPIDVHVVPLHQLSSWFFYHLFGLNFSAATFLLMAVLCFSAALLFSSMRKVAGDLPAAVGVVLVLANPFWGGSLFWWSAALHRVSLALFFSLAFFVYIRHREVGGRINAWLLLALVLFAFGFYSKALMIPVAIVLFELVLSAREGRWTVNASFVWLMLPTVILSACMVAYYQAPGPDVLRPSHGLGFGHLMQVSTHSLERFVLSFIFVRQTAYAAPYWFFAIVIATGFLLHFRPKAIYPLIAAILLLLASSFLLAVGRGDWVLFDASIRYVSDDLFLILPFLVLFIKDVCDGCFGSVGKKYAAFGVLAVYVLIGASVSDRVMPRMLPNSPKAKSYMTNLFQSYRVACPDRCSFYFVDSNFPEFLYGFAGSTRKLSTVLAYELSGSHWVANPSDAPADKALYEVTGAGVIALVR